MPSCRYIDCHAHLTLGQFDGAELESSLERCVAEDIYVVAVSENLDECRTMRELWHGSSNLEATSQGSAEPSTRLRALYRRQVALCLGLHPAQLAVQKGPDNSVGSSYRSVHPDQWPAFLSFSEPLLTSTPASVSPYVGIGEVGLDFTPHVLRNDVATDGLTQQRTVFRRHAELAQRHGLPLNIHSRQAGRHLLDELEALGYGANSTAAGSQPAVLLHAFDGKPSVIRRGLALGCYFSIAPIVVREPAFQRLMTLVPIDRLVLESDSPALGPVKGETNHPYNVTLAARYVADAKGITVEEVAHRTTQNALRIFPRLCQLWPWAADYTAEFGTTTPEA
ncbi:putative deoxyribonuclease tatdn3 [Tieghemiomyces parasiticus]|uniref:Deoxyribonuclease tatdn3 n=1 Tax=Tieghemiomyces parasiticus TaxID=78921 RepID=A0A9W8DGW4_9FUNG|nr:putative deoxyribonuclease tatdn3 [Tieghemiomyces parasiticus]